MHGDQGKQQIIDTFDRAADSYEQVGVDYFGRFGARLVEIVSLEPGHRVLDLGCGRGAVTFPAASTVGPTGRVLGIDAAPGMVALTAAEAAARGLTQVELRPGDAEFPPGEPCEFDAILAGCVLFFIPDLAGALERYARLLRPGGLLAFSWFGADDTRWQPVFAALGTFAPAGWDRKTDRDPGWAEPASLHALLADRGYLDIDTVEETFEVTVRDVDQWWDWSFSHGGRDYFEALPADRHDDIKAAATAAMGEVQRPDGSLSMRPVLRFTTGRTRRQ
ncbi:MAG: methyltransferase domain-containing protein [Sporichthyaceae bacterium]|nr:methyltransferase domain-containing protein [Sporichthyaceae bacterium]